MSFSLHLSVPNLDRLKRKLGADWTKPIQTAAQVVGEELRTIMAQAPGPSHSPVIWGTEKSRRWYFANRRKKKLSLQYTRGSDSWSQTLSKSWTVRPEGETSAVVGTHATYAPWVQSHKKLPTGERQTRQHKATGWVTDKQAVQEIKRGGKARRIFRDIIRKMLNR